MPARLPRLETHGDRRFGIVVIVNDGFSIVPGVSELREWFHVTEMTHRRIF